SPSSAWARGSPGRAICCASRPRHERERRISMTYTEFQERRSFAKRELLAFAHGRLIDDPPAGFEARLPLPPLLMLDRIVELGRETRPLGRHRAGRRRADLHPLGGARGPVPRPHLCRLPGGVGSRSRGAARMSATRVALVTCGGTGIGAACCRAIATAGFRVV